MSARDDLVKVIRDHEGDVIAATFESLADAILAAGWRPPARAVSRETAVEALPVGSVLIDLDDDVIIQRTSAGEFGWQEPGSDERIDSSEIPRPQTLLHEGSKR